MTQDLRFESNSGRTWAVVGYARFKQADISGILEWCRTKQEAKREVRRLSQDYRYHNLKAKEVE